MESPILKLKREKGPNLILLSRAKTIREEDTEVHAEWVIVKKWYDDAKAHPDLDWVDKAVTTVLNSIIHQKRGAFGMTYEKTRELLKDDSNWDKPIGLSNNKNGKPDTKYTMLCNKLVEAGIAEQIKEQGHKEPRCFRVINEGILDMLNLSTPLEDQEAELLNFVNNNKDLDHGSAKGSAKGEAVKKEISKEGKEQELSSSEKLSFKDLLFRQHPDDFPSFDEVQYLAQLAVTNCEDFEVNSYALTVLGKHLKGTCKGKVSTKQKDLIAKLVGAFENEALKYVAMLTDIDIQEPEQLTNKATKNAIDKEKAVQNNTLNTLNATFHDETMRVLYKQLAEETDEHEKSQIQHEINYWEKTQ